MTSVRCIRLDTAGNRGFSGARIVPGADAWRERETSMRLDPDGWLVRRNVADATIMKTRMRLRSHIGGGVCLSERNEKKCQKLCKGDVLPLDRSLLTLQRHLYAHVFKPKELGASKKPLA
jgi:hypothetical protein